MDKISNVQAAEATMMTDLGEMPTEIDAQSFAKFANKMNSQHVDINSEGITAKEVLRLSRKIDIEKANKQINWAVPAKIKKTKQNRFGIEFRTQASNLYGAQLHIVTVEFLQSRNFVTALSKQKPLQVAQDMVLGKLKFDCDCGRHRYWYRFIAHAGRWSIGAPETRFPKIRNPRLTGVACKHVVRVMHEIGKSRATLNMIVKYMDKPIDHVNAEKNIKRRQAAMLKAPKRVVVKREAMIKRADVAQTTVKKKVTKQKPRPSIAQQTVAKQLKALMGMGYSAAAAAAMIKTAQGMK